MTITPGRRRGVLCINARIDGGDVIPADAE
jgi:hypothetical protein